MSYEQLLNKATLVMQKIKLQNMQQSFLLGMVCNSFVEDSTIDGIIESLNKILELTKQGQLKEKTPDQMIFLIYQNLHKQSNGKNVNQIQTPQLSDSGSPELKPFKPQLNINPLPIIEQIQSNKNCVYWEEKDVIQGNRMYWEQKEDNENYLYSSSKMESEIKQPEIKTNKDIDIETQALIQKLMEDDRQAQLQQKRNLQEQDQTECPICCDTLMESEIYPIDGCNHVYHLECIKQYLIQAMSEKRISINCPDSECKNQLKEHDIGFIAGKEKQIEYNKYTLDKFVDTHADEMSWCPTPDCGYAFVLGNDNNDGDNDFQCPLCSKRYCLNCRVLFHEKQSCKEYQITNTRDQNDVKFEKFVQGKKFKMCTKCKFWVEKNQGCDHMTCRCGYQFCYKCGGKYMACECIEKQKLKQQQLQEQHRLRIEKQKEQKNQARKVRQKRK